MSDKQKIASFKLERRFISLSEPFLDRKHTQDFDWLTWYFRFQSLKIAPVQFDGAAFLTRLFIKIPYVNLKTW